MTDCTALLRDRLGGVGIVEIWRMMIGGLKIRPFWIVTFRATERRIDLTVAYQTIRHLRHIGGRWMV